MPCLCANVSAENAGAGMSSVDRRINFVNRLNCEAHWRGLLGNLTADQWKTAIAYFDARCAYCGRGHTKLTADHFIPQHLGGHTTASNIVPACVFCNSWKGCRSPYHCRWFFPRQNFLKVCAYLKAQRLTSLSPISWERKSHHEKTIASTHTLFARGA